MPSLKPMDIWLVTVGEPWPTDGENPRLHRTGIQAGFLASQGHHVIYWSGTFDHSSKKERTGHDVDRMISPNYRLIGIEAGSYRRNISFERIAYHRAVARRFLEASADKRRPDLIVVSLTPLELACAAVKYGQRNNVPVIVDVRDFWPDIWAEKLPAPLRPYKRLLLKPFYDDLKAAIRNATAIIGITDAAVDWALQSVGREKSPNDRAFPLIYPADKPSEGDLRNAMSYWNDQNFFAGGNEIIGCFFGTFTTRVDFETPLRGIQLLPETLRERFRLVLCGRGENEHLIRHYAQSVPQILCPGWVDAPEIIALMRMSRFGLLPYPPRADFVRSLPNKVFEYLNGGLPIITSLRGEIENLLSAYHCGALYEANRPETFAQLLSALLQDPKRLDYMAHGAKQAVRAYDSANISRDFERYLGQIAN